MAERLADIDFKSMNPDDLSGLARSAWRKRDYIVAATAQYWSVRKSQRGRYDLACYLARLGQTDSAFYWLQLAAIEDGVDAPHAQRDSDLESLRADPRWNKILPFLEDCNKYFAAAAITRTVLILPKGYKKPTAIPTVLWMHGLGSEPEDFVNDQSQRFADKLNVALIGVSGTTAKGPRSFVWADDVELDAKTL